MVDFYGRAICTKIWGPLGLLRIYSVKLYQKRAGVFNDSTFNGYKLIDAQTLKVHMIEKQEFEEHFEWIKKLVDEK